MLSAFVGLFVISTGLLLSAAQEEANETSQQTPTITGMRCCRMTVENNPSLYAPKAVLKSEDWWAVWLGLLIFALGIAPIWGLDLLGWVPKYNVWLDAGKAFDPNGKSYAYLGGWGSALVTYLFLLAITTVGAIFMGNKPKRFILGFTANRGFRERAARLLNIKLSPACVAGEAGTRRIISFIKTWCDLKLWHLQFNIINKETLLAAQKDPQKYRNLLVRVAGYSAYFIDLTPELQNDVIARTEHGAF